MKGDFIVSCGYETRQIAVDMLLLAHVENFSHKSITTKDFKDFLYRYFEKHHSDKIRSLDSVNWDAWFHKPGMVRGSVLSALIKIRT